MESLLNTVWALIESHSAWAYLVILLAGVPEGPILTVLCGYAASRGLLNPVLVYLCVVVGDMIGDSLWYLAGRTGNPLLLWIASFFGVTPKSLNELRRMFIPSQFRLLALSKLIHGAGVIGLVVAGMVRLAYMRYLLNCLVITLGQSAVLLVVGMVAGEAQEKLAQYLNWYAAVGSLLLLAVSIGLFTVSKVGLLFTRSIRKTLNGGSS